MKVLIISPHFPPTNAADMQRVRLILPYVREQGVEAEVLSVEPAQVASPQDAWLAAGLPTDVPVHRVQALDLKWGRLPGLGAVTFRAFRAIRREGDEVLGRKAESGKLKAERGDQRSENGGRRSEFDLVYFSTTQFGIHVLGPYWKQKFGVPFVMDYQDPWVSDYYREHPGVVPPGGRLKYGIVSKICRWQEPRVLRECSGITSVSAAYPEQLAKRYPWLRVEEFSTAKAVGRERRARPLVGNCVKRECMDASDASRAAGDQWTDRAGSALPALTLPFPGDVWDFERVRAEGVRQSAFDPGDGLKHWVYVGVCPPSMLKAVRALFAALASHAAADKRADRAGSALPRLHFIGTSYAAAGTGVKIVEPLAAEYGLSEMVHESTDRIPYSETLRCLLDADALIIPGSDDPGYTASKIYPYLLAEKPLLAVFHEQSSVVELIRKVGGGRVIAFASEESSEAIGNRITREWLDGGGSEQVVPLDREAFAPYSARAQAAMLVEFWKKCVTPDQ
jgi:hypothetical protein